MELLALTIASIKAQDYENWEVLLVDDGSEDEQFSSLQSFAGGRIGILRRTDGMKGPSRCRNLGVEAANGEFVLFIDSDDILAPWCLSQRVALLKRVTDADVWIFPVMLFHQQPGDTKYCWNQLEGDDDLERFLRSDPPWHTSSALWRKQAFQSLGGFNEKVLYGDDADLHTRALLSEFRVRKFPEQTHDVFIRRGKESRITNRFDQAMIESRQTRLVEGLHALEEMSSDPELLQIWEGQYFVEAEKLLFGSDNAKQEINDVIIAWTEFFQPPWVRKWIVWVYFNFGLLSRRKAYLLLRIARRMAKLLLPREFFPSGGFFETYECEPEVAFTIKNQLRERQSRSLEHSKGD